MSDHAALIRKVHTDTLREAAAVVLGMHTTSLRAVADRILALDTAPMTENTLPLTCVSSTVTGCSGADSRLLT